MFPATLYGRKKLVYTADGSITFYNLDFKEGYRAKSIGAFTESLHKFVRPSEIEELIQRKPVTILDLFTGTGYNLAVLLEIILKIKKRKDAFIVSVDKDESIIDLITRSYFLWPNLGFNCLKALLKGVKIPGITFNYYITEGRSFIENCNFLFDIIFFDPFSKKNNSYLWTKEIYKKLFDILVNGGKLLTYASSKFILDDFKKVGFKQKKIMRLMGGFAHSTVFIK
jgi:chorismate dehydratase